MLEEEVSILQRVRHKNCVSMIEIFENPKYVYLVMELVTGGKRVLDVMDQCLVGFFFFFICEIDRYIIFFQVIGSDWCRGAFQPNY